MLMPQLGLASVSMLWPRRRLGLISSALPRLEASEPLSYDTISLFMLSSILPFYILCLRPKDYVQNIVSRCKLNVFGVCVTS